MVLRDMFGKLSSGLRILIMLAFDFTTGPDPSQVVGFQSLLALFVYQFLWL